MGDLVVILSLCLAWFAYCIYSEFRGSPFEKSRARKHAKKEAEKRAQDYPLHWAIEHGRLGVVDSLLMRGANLNSRDERGQTPLHTAALHNRLEEVKCLLKAGADPNVRETPGPLVKHEFGSDPAKLDEWGLSPLHVAVWFTDNLDIVTALLDAGADPNMRANFDRTPLHGPGPTFVPPRTRETHKAIVRALVKAGADLEVRNETQLWTPLHEAAQQSAIATEALLEAGADVEARCYDGWTPLLLAVATPNLAAAKVLFVNGHRKLQGFGH